jgi:hypothetical protein
MEHEPTIDALWEEPEMGTHKDAPEISRDPHTSEPLEETGLQIPTTDQHEKKENPWDNPYNKIPGDDEPDTDEKKQPTLH